MFYLLLLDLPILQTGDDTLYSSPDNTKVGTQLLLFTISDKLDNHNINKSMSWIKLKVQFHVDDLKVSHKEQAILDNFLDKLRNEFEQEDELTENGGLIHKYLGITID